MLLVDDDAPTVQQQDSHDGDDISLDAGGGGRLLSIRRSSTRYRQTF